MLTKLFFELICPYVRVTKPNTEETMNNIMMTAKGLILNSSALIVGVVAFAPTTPSGVTIYEPLLGSAKSQGFLAGKISYLDC